ncbi:hypothetical protein ACFLSQ_11435 [Bacteroidota bacterium]
MQIKLFYFLLVVLFLLCSCDKENPSDLVLQYKVIKPLAIGNSWTYQRFDTFNSDNQLIDTVVYDIWKKSGFDNETCYHQRLNGDTIHSSRFINRNSGLFLISGNFGSLMFQIAKYPINIFDSVCSWDGPMTTLADPDGIDSLRLKVFKKVTGTDTIINVPAGSFSCIEISEFYYGFAESDTGQEYIDSILAETFSLVEYYSFDTGLIKRNLVRQTKDGELDIRNELLLLNYDVK